MLSTADLASATANRALVAADLAPTAAGIALAAADLALAAAARKRGKRAKGQIKIDTGLHRIGFEAGELDALAEVL